MLTDFVMSDRTVLMRAAKLFKCGMCNTDVLILYDINNSNLLEQFEFKFFDYNFLAVSQKVVDGVKLSNCMKQ